MALGWAACLKGALPVDTWWSDLALEVLWDRPEWWWPQYNVTLQAAADLAMEVSGVFGSYWYSYSYENKHVMIGFHVLVRRVLDWFRTLAGSHIYVWGIGRLRICYGCRLGSRHGDVNSVLHRDVNWTSKEISWLFVQNYFKPENLGLLRVRYFVKGCRAAILLMSHKGSS